MKAKIIVVKGIQISIICNWYCINFVLKIHINIKGMWGEYPDRLWFETWAIPKKRHLARKYWLIGQLLISSKSTYKAKKTIFVLHILPGLSGYVITIS
jgi:hypothetical protein